MHKGQDQVNFVEVYHIVGNLKLRFILYKLQYVFHCGQYPASIQSRATIGPPVKRNSYVVSLTGQ